MSYAADSTAGDAYAISAEDIASFKKGETVTVKFSVSDIKSESGMLGFDINLKLNTDYVTTPIVNDDIDKANASNTTIKALNTNGGKWTISGRMDNKDETVLIITILEDNAVDAVMPGKSFYFMISFVAKKDSEAGKDIITVAEAGGTSGKIETVTGKGTTVKTAGETPTASPASEPTAKPSQAPSATATNAPSQDNTKPNPTTADPGLICVAVMALASLSVVNKKFKK